MRCAACGFDVQADFAFCPKCGSKLPAACPGCGTPSPPDFAFCPRCGTRLAAAPAAGSGPSTEARAPAGLRSSGEARASAGSSPSVEAPISAPTEARAVPIPAATEARTAGAGAPGTAGERADGDRRLVTVLFADLSGFTALSERLDAEDVRAFQADLFQELAGAIERYEGFVEKFVGDAVMAVFGAPVAHEDDAERALHAALAMQERMEGLNRRWQRRLGRSLALHVGVNTGPVVAGNIGTSSGAAYAVTGDTVNTASRLQSAAQPGQILASDATYRLAQHAFAFEALGELALKGKAAPVPVYRALGALGARRAARGLEAHGLSAPLVGRDDELQQMLGAFDRMLRGRAQVVSLVGDAGVGKSRLIREFLAKLQANGRLAATAVRRAACSSLGEQTYGVLAAFLRQAYGIAHDESFATARQKLRSGLEAIGTAPEEGISVAEVLSRMLGLESGRAELHPQIEPEQLKRQIFLAVRTVIERRLEHGPLLLIAEDLHWADTASVELLRFIVDRLADRPLILVASHRPAFDTGALVSGRATHTAIRLVPLSPDQSMALLEALFGASAPAMPPRLRELVVSRTGGNPFYLEEVVRGLIAGGVLVRETTGWRCTADVATVDVPPTIQGLLLSRIDRLPPEARQLLQEAAVLGLTFDAKLLRMVAADPNACDACLDLLRDAELLEEAARSAGGAGGQHRFSHGLVQEVVYQNLLVRRRTELHERAGRALERLCGGRPQRLEDLEALGRHFGLSSDKSRGARYLRAAGDWARAIYANDDALRHYTRALGTLRECEGSESEVVAVRELLGDLLGLAGQREGALEHYEAVRQVFEAAGDRPAQARLWRKIGGLYWNAGDRDRALAGCQTGLQLLEGASEHIELAHLYQEMGRIAFRTGDNQGAREWAERGIAHAERLAASRAGPAEDGETSREITAASAQAYNTLGIALARMGRSGEAVEYIEKSLAVAQAQGLLQAACRSYANLGVLYSTLDPGRSIEMCQSGLDVAKKIGDLGFQSRLYTNLAVAYCTLTNRCDEEGIGAAQAAIELDRRLGQLDHLAVPLIVLGQIYQCHGQPRLALERYREALALAEEVGEPQLLFPCYDGLATLCLEMGDEAQAEQYMLRAQQVCEGAGLEPDSLVVLPFLE